MKPYGLKQKRVGPKYFNAQHNIVKAHARRKVPKRFHVAWSSDGIYLVDFWGNIWDS